MTEAARHLLAALHALEGRDDALLASLDEAAWSAVAALAIKQRVGPLLFETSGLPIPPAVRQTLKARATTAATRSLQLQAALRELATEVAPLGIDLIVLKGMHLALAVYAAPALREMGDIDVLVREDHLSTVVAAATALGFTPAHGAHAEHHLPPMIRGRIVFEFHNTLDSRPWQHAVREWSTTRIEIIDLPDNIKALSVEDLLVHSCMHSADAHAMESGLRALCDVQAILTRHGGTLDWRHVSTRARTWQCERSVELLLRLCHRYLGVMVPVTSQSVSPPQDVLDCAIAHIFDSRPAPSDAAAAFTTAGLWSKLRLLCDRLRRPTGESALQRTNGLMKRHGAWLVRANLFPPRAMREALARRTRITQWLREKP